MTPWDILSRRPSDPPTEPQSSTEAQYAQAAAPYPPADLSQGDQFYRNGQYDEAIAVYRSVMAGGQEPKRQQAQYRLARTYLAAYRYEEAARELESYIAIYPADADTLRAHFLLSQAYIGLQRIEDAEQVFIPYATAGGPAAAYGHLALAQALADSGRPREAAIHLEQALSSELPQNVADDARWSLAQAYAASQQPDLALAQYERLLSETDSAYNRAQALWGIATVSGRLGDQERWYNTLLSVIRDYPRYWVAAAAVDELLTWGIDVEPFSQGVAYFYRRRNDESVAALERYLASGPGPAGAAVAHYYLGILAERLNDNDTAVQHYEASEYWDPVGPLAAEAMWGRAQLLESAGQFDAAAEVYSRLWQLLPASDRAKDAAVKAGIIRYKQGRYEDASQMWNAWLPTVSSQQEIARVNLWLGKAAQARGDTEAARTYWAYSMGIAPTSFYGLRAELLLAGRPYEPDVANAEGQLLAGAGPAWDEVEAWLSFSGSSPNATAYNALSQSRPWLVGVELYELGLSQQAAQEFRRLLAQQGDDAWAVYYLMRHWNDMGLTHLAAAAALRLQEIVGGAPKAVLAQAYPWDYDSLVTSAAERNNISPLFILSVIRQESLFDPIAGSSAGAQGLTQVMPSTGQGIAQQLGRSDFATADLLRPAVSIEFGAYYLGAQMALFDNSAYNTLAAYNGGPGSALRWSQRGQVTDPDLFYEEIDFSETRLYLRLVLENYAMYRFLYAGADHPTLLTTP